jgi:hypothetical protein
VHALRRPTAFAVLAFGAGLLALLMVIGGTGHTLAVIGARGGRAYDFRFAALITNGGILVYGGVTNLALSPWIARGRTWALAWSAAVTAALVTYCVILLPLATARGGAVPALALNVTYLAWALLLLRRAHVPARQNG